MAIHHLLVAAMIATAATARKCKYPPQTVQKSPASSTPCKNGVQTFALQAVNCSNPYNGYYVTLNGASGEDIAEGTFQVGVVSYPIPQFYLNGTTVEPVSSSTPGPSIYNSTTPVTVPYANNGRGQSIPSGPVRLSKYTSDKSLDGSDILPCQRVKGFLVCNGPHDGGKYFSTVSLSGLSGPGTVYIDNTIPPPNPNDGGSDQQFGLKFRMVNTCKL